MGPRPRGWNRHSAGHQLSSEVFSTSRGGERWAIDHDQLQRRLADAHDSVVEPGGNPDHRAGAAADGGVLAQLDLGLAFEDIKD